MFEDLSKAAERIVKVDSIVQPVDKWVEAYDKLYPYYADMYKHLDKDLKKLRQVVES